MPPRRTAHPPRRGQQIWIAIAPIGHDLTDQRHNHEDLQKAHKVEFEWGEHPQAEHGTDERQLRKANGARSGRDDGTQGSGFLQCLLHRPRCDEASCVQKVDVTWLSLGLSRPGPVQAA